MNVRVANHVHKLCVDPRTTQYGWLHSLRSADQMNHPSMTTRTPIRNSVRRRISSAPTPGRMSTNADAPAKTALTSNPTGMAT